MDEKSQFLEPKVKYVTYEIRDGVFTPSETKTAGISCDKIIKTGAKFFSISILCINRKTIYQSVMRKKSDVSVR